MRTDILERKEEILQWIEEEKPKRFIYEQLNCKPETLNSYLEKMDINYAGQQAKKGQYKGANKYKDVFEYLEKSTNIKSSILRKKLIESGVKEDRCEICGISEWQGVKLPLELHHKDTNHYNNSLENLQILCPNCHSITKNWRGRNIQREEKKISDQEMIEAIKTTPNIRQALLKVGLAPKGGNYKRVYELKAKYNI